MKTEMKLKDYFALDFVNWLNKNCFDRMYSDETKSWGQYPEDDEDYQERYSLKELLIKFKNENKLC